MKEKPGTQKHDAEPIVLAEGYNPVPKTEPSTKGFNPVPGEAVVRPSNRPHTPPPKNQKKK